MTSEAERLSDAELQSLRNLGNEAEAAADEIERLRAELRRLSAGAQRYAFLRDTWWFAIKPADLGQALTADQLDELIDQAQGGER